MLRAVKLSELSRNVFFHGVILAEVYRQKEEILFPFLNFLNRYRVSENRSPLLTAETWKTLYFFGPGKPRTLRERQEYYKFKSWIFDNPHYSSWLFKSTSMYAPREYMIPELKKLLIVTPRYFGAHFFPSYTPDLLSDFSSDKLSYLKFLIPLEGVEYLIAHCHGVPTSYICKWTGKTEVEIHQAVLDSVGTFANKLPYLIWAYGVDMRAVPFTQKQNSRCKFTKRFSMWTNLNERPQFCPPRFASLIFPKYLQNAEALRSLPRRRVAKPIDKLFLVRPLNRELPRRKLSRYKNF